MSDRVAAFIDRQGLLARRQGVVVGVSGGSDSVALLTVLAELADRPERRYRLVAAHLNHGLRVQADADARFVIRLANRLKIPCVCERADVRGLAVVAGVGAEQAGRELRYDFFARTARAAGCQVIATGHQADDQAETVLHRILRGTGLEGLAGIPAARKLEGGLRVIRPLLTVTREEAQAYLRRRRQRWRTDATNIEPAYATRNRIRAELLPVLRREYNPRVDQALVRLAGLAADAGPLLEQLGRDALERLLRKERPGELTLDLPALRATGSALAALAIRAAIGRLRTPLQEIGRAQVEQILSLLSAPPGAPLALDLPGGLRAQPRKHRLILSRRPQKPGDTMSDK